MYVSLPKGDTMLILHIDDLHKDETPSRESINSSHNKHSCSQSPPCVQDQL